MKKKINSKLSDKEHVEIFKGISKIGAKQASNALSILIGKDIGIEVVKVNITSPENIPHTIGDPEMLVSSVFLSVVGDVSGNIILIFPQDDALTLTGFLTDKKDVRILDEMGRSALKETGNIIVGSFLSALSNYLRKNLIESVPDISSDMLGSTIDWLLIKYSQKTNKVVCLNIDLVTSGGSNPVECFLFFLLDENSAFKILNSLKNNKK